ncbi:cortical cell-delineating protein-like [Oryza brachyantha]|uniref:Bifunctional inhibitor/plant lipid transfer protein/seed storage helical domain-containing protein n=1 Tax=Oryza brachyantha TaxID=4533 RepID=J3N4Q5_ORYBR|nr:cortical cell-delineating protein-like [Oryza brachyantha]
MAASKVAPFLALSSVLLLAVAAHGCAPHCSGGGGAPAVVVVPPPVVVQVPVLQPSYHGHGHCPIDALKLRVCASVLNGALGVNAGHGAYDCCPLLSGIADVDAAVCLCTAIKANVLGVNLDVPVDLRLILNKCGKTCPSDFTC